MSWEEIQREYPDMWAFMKNIKRDESGDIISFELLGVYSKKEKAEQIKRFMDAGEPFECVRTTVNIPTLGVII